jgi:hypothetical protein
MDESGTIKFLMRSLVSSKEAGVLIGKNGSKIQQMRDETGIITGVSKMIPKVSERIVSLSGSINEISAVPMNLTQGGRVDGENSSRRSGQYHYTDHFSTFNCLSTCWINIGKSWQSNQIYSKEFWYSVILFQEQRLLSVKICYHNQQKGWLK